MQGSRWNLYFQVPWDLVAHEFQVPYNVFQVPHFAPVTIHVCLCKILRPHGRSCAIFSRPRSQFSRHFLLRDAVNANPA